MVAGPTAGEQGLRMYVECQCRWPVRSFSNAGRSTRIQLRMNGECGGRRESSDHAPTRRFSVGGIARMEDRWSKTKERQPGRRPGDQDVGQPGSAAVQ